MASVSAQRTFDGGQFTIPVSDDTCLDDANGAGAGAGTLHMKIDAAGDISDVNIAIHITHTYRSDLQIGVMYRELVFEYGPIVLANGIGGGADNFHVTFDSDAASACSEVCANPDACNTPPGPTCRPDTSLDSAVSGLDAPGVFHVTRFP